MAAIALFGLGTLHTAQAGPALYDGTLFVPCCGGGTAGATPTPTAYVGGSPTSYPGTHWTGGVINLAASGTPRAFTLPGGSMMHTGVDYNTGPSVIIQSTEFFNFSNLAGSFFAGGGAGAESFMASTFAAGPLGYSATNINGYPRRGNVFINPSNDQFGGTMGLVGGIVYQLFITGVGGGLMTGTWPIGAGHAGIANRNWTFSKGTFTHTTLYFPSYISATVTGWKWTTGQVVVSDTPGFYSTMITRTGTHNINSAGTTGTIQLVSPSFWQFSSPYGLFTDPEGGIFDYTLHLVPEPSSTIMLSAALLTLAGLYRVRKKL
jgi:hypothetical protein